MQLRSSSLRVIIALEIHSGATEGCRIGSDGSDAASDA